MLVVTDVATTCAEVSHHQSQVNGCGHLNVLSLVCVTLLVSFAIMSLAVRLKWHRSIVIGLF